MLLKKNNKLVEKNAKALFRAEQNFADFLLQEIINNIRKENRFCSTLRNDFASILQNIDVYFSKKKLDVFSFSQFYSFFVFQQEAIIKNFIIASSLQFSEKIVAYFSFFQKTIADISKRISAFFQEEDISQYYYENIKEDIGVNLFSVDMKDIEKFFNRKWTKDGKTFQQRFASLSTESIKNIEKIYKEGLKKGLGYKEISKNIKNQVAINGVQVEKIVRTEGQRIQNDILMKSYYKNRDIISGIEFIATLDVRTCEICGSYDGNQYFFDKDIKTAPYIPVHPRCRCTYVPISKLWEDLGIKPSSERSSMFGPTTGLWSAWLLRMEKRQEGFAKDILGKNYQAWKDGEYDLKTFKFEPQSTVGDFFQRERLTANLKLKQEKEKQEKEKQEKEKQEKEKQEKEKEILQKIVYQDKKNKKEVKKILKENNLTEKEIIETFGYDVFYDGNWKFVYEELNQNKYLYVDFIETEEGKGRKLSRIFNFTEKVIDHSLFKIEKELQGKDFAKRMLRNSFDLYKKLGIEKITLIAADNVGGYAWARAGFSAGDIEDYKDILKTLIKNEKLKKIIDNFKNIQDISNFTVDKEVYDAFFSNIGLNEDFGIAGFKLEIMKEKKAIDGNLYKIGKAFLMGQMWEGELDLLDKKQVELFLKYINYYEEGKK